MVLRVRDDYPVMATEAERRHLRALERVLVEQEGIGPTIIGPDGGKVPVPRSLNRLLQEITHLLAIGEAVEIVSLPRELTLVEVAELLNESETVVQELVRAGRFSLATDEPARVPLADVIAYKDRRDTERRQALEELIQLNQELGLYPER